MNDLTEKELLSRIVEGMVYNYEATKQLCDAIVDTNMLLRKIINNQTTLEGKFELLAKDVKRIAIDASPVGPELEEIHDYFLDIGSTKEIANKFNDEFTMNKWRDSKGNKITNWKRLAKYWVNQWKQQKAKKKITNID